MEQKFALRDEIEKQAKYAGLDRLVDVYDKITQEAGRINLRKFDGIYLFAETNDNEDAAFLSAKNLLEREVCNSDNVLVINGLEANGFPGFKKWQAQLIRDYGIVALPIDIPNPSGVNTLSESECVVRYTKEHTFSSILSIAPQFHLLRAFMTLASVTIREYPGLSVFPYPGADQDWNQVVSHSQGKVRSRRMDLVKGEIERIKRYQSIGDLEPTEKIIEYISEHQKNNGPPHPKGCGL